MPLSSQFLDTTLDTNILSERRKPKPEPRVTAFYDGQSLNALYSSVVGIAEIRFGIELQEDVAGAGAGSSRCYLRTLGVTG